MNKQPEPPEIKITIRQQNRRTLAMRLSPYGEIDVLIPYWIKPGSREVRRFIDDTLPKLTPHLPKVAPTQQHSQPQIRRWIKRWAVKIGVEPGRIQFRAMYRKWGSCSSRGTVTFNAALQYLPGHLVEYVIVHELVHLIHLNHDTVFWEKVEEFMPDYRSLERELDRYHL